MLNTAQTSSISILTPMKGVTKVLPLLLMFPLNFNSHPHEGGDLADFYKSAPTLSISILTPMKGVTLLVKAYTGEYIFQFSPP